MNKTRDTEKHLDLGLVLFGFRLFRQTQIFLLAHKSNTNAKQSKATIQAAGCTRHLEWLIGKIPF